MRYTTDLLQARTFNLDKSEGRGVYDKHSLMDNFPIHVFLRGWENEVPEIEISDRGQPVQLLCTSDKLATYQKLF